MKRIIHWYRAYKWLKKMKREEDKEDPEKVCAQIHQDMIDWALRGEAKKLGYTIFDEKGNVDWIVIHAFWQDVYFPKPRVRNWNKFSHKYFKERQENEELKKVFENGFNLTYIK